ncbi:hypothetical protein J4470_04065 [Candidatus Woesearchaeota archaeon]|nr:hypothetical protein [Candidatus Woesearchaeota archaeon]
MMPKCGICGIEMEDGDRTANPLLCRWCEIYYEREYERDGSYRTPTLF